MSRSRGHLTRRGALLSAAASLVAQRAGAGPAAIRQTLLTSRPKPASGGYYDDFSGAAATLNGQTLDQGGVTWTLEKGGSANTSTPALDGSGTLNVNGGSAPRTNAAYITPSEGVRPDRYGAIRLATTLGDVTTLQAVPLLCDITLVTASTFKFHGFSTTVQNGTASITMWASPTAAALFAPSSFNYPTGATAVSAVGRHGGDVIGVSKRTVGAQVFHDIYLNGRKVSVGTGDYAASGVTINDNFGISGGNSGVTPGAAPEASDFWYGDPTLHAMIRVVHPGKTMCRKNWPGSANVNDVNVPIPFEYSISDPQASDIRVTFVSVDGAGNETPMTGYIDMPASNFVITTPIGSNLWGAARVTYTLAAADAPATLQMFAKVERIIAGGVRIPGYTPIMRPGHGVIVTGQSLSVKLSQATCVWGAAGSPLPGGYTNAPNCWQVDGTNDGPPSTSILRRVVGSSCTQATYVFSNSPHGYFCRTLVDQLAGTAVPDTSVTYYRTGHGGTTTKERAPVANGGSAVYDCMNAILDGLALGVDANVGIDNGGIFDADHTANSASAQKAETRQALIDIWTAVEAAVGHPLHIILNYPPWGAAAANATNDARMDAVCRAKWELANDGTTLPLGSVFYIGDAACDIQHTGTGDTGTGAAGNDGYHMTSGPNGWPEMARRMAWGAAKVLGAASYNRNGPIMTGVQSWTSNSVTVRYDKNGASALEINAGNLSDWRLGQTFTAGDTTFATGNQIVPNALPTITDIDSQYADVTYVFAGTPFSSPSAKPCVRGPAKMNPFNRDMNATTLTSTTTNMSLLRGVFSGENYNIPITRFFHASGNDYLVGA